MSITVMSAGKEATTVLTVLGNVPHPPAVQQKTDDSVKPVHEDKKDEGSVDVDYDPDSSDEDGQPALRVETSTEQLLRNGQLPLEQPALRDPLSMEQQTLIEHVGTKTPALSVEPMTALVQEPSSHHEKRSVEKEGTSADDTSDSEMSTASDLIMREGPGIGSPAADTAKPASP
jgi:hypothetical protein